MSLPPIAKPNSAMCSSINGAMQHAKLCDFSRNLADIGVFSFDKALIIRLTPRWPTGVRNAPSLDFFEERGYTTL
jgi:hypothetical protein